MDTTIKMNSINTKNPLSAFVFSRDSHAYFKEVLRTQPQMFDQSNAALINTGNVPFVNTQWIKHTPSHAAFKDAKIIHHLWMQGNIAVAIPEPIHHRWSSALHPYC